MQIRRSKRWPRILSFSTSTLEETEIADQLALTCTESEGIVTDSRNLIEGYRPGQYVRIQLPCEMIGNFDPNYCRRTSLLPAEERFAIIHVPYFLGLDRIPKYPYLYSWRSLHPLNALLRYLFQSLYLTPASAVFIRYRQIHPSFKSWGYCYWCFVGCSSFDQDC